MTIPLNLRVLLIISALFIAGSFYLMNRDSKPKNDYDKVTGRLKYIDSKLGNLPNRHFGKYRYLVIDNYEYPLEIFIGKDPGDFKPKFEKIDSLKVGYIISIYGYEDSNTKVQRINRNVQFIDKENDLYFERGDSSKSIGIGLISISILLALIGLFAFHKNKIPF